MKPTKDDVQRVKGLGCLQNKKDENLFNVRVVTKSGKLSAAQQKKITAAAEQFGSGDVILTTRLSVEIQNVPYEKIDALLSFLKEDAIEAGGTGPKVRPIVACKGSTCKHGLIDTQSLADKLHERFYLGWHDQKLPHKLKIAVGGCPHNCVKPDLNDIGIIGWRGQYKVTLGGRWGKKCERGTELDMLYPTEEAVLGLVERVLCFYRDHGEAGERLAETIARVGWDEVQSIVK